MTIEINDELDELLGSIEKGSKEPEDKELDVKETKVSGEKELEEEEEEESKELEEMRRSLDDSYAPPQQQQKKEEEKKQTVEFEKHNFLEGITDVEEIFKSPEAFNSFLQKVYSKAAEAGYAKAVETFSTNAPSLVDSQVNSRLAIYNATERFYTDNPDLSRYRNTVGAIARKVAEKYPDKPLDKIFAVTATLARKHLMLKAPQKQEKGTTERSVMEKKAKFPNTQSSAANRRDAKKPTGIVSEIDDMLGAI